MSGNVLQVETGSLYPALHRLERRGWVRAEWRTSEKNQRAKYYRLTPGGRRQLLAQRKTWDQMVAAVSSVIRPA